MSIQLSNIKILTQIEDLYPDIRQQLCNRHSQFYSKIKDIFANIYDNQQPQFFISLKGIFQIFQISCISVSISMALENGIVISLTKLSQNDNIYVNSNYEEQEIILSSKGEIIQSNKGSVMSQWIQMGFQIASKFSNQSNFNGGIIYIHNNIQIDELKFKQANILGGCLIFLLINGLIDKVSIRQIYQILKQISNVGPFLFDFNNNQLIKKTQNIYESITLKNSTWKFIICNIISDEQEIKQLQKLKQISEMQNKFLRKLICEKFGSQEKSFHQMMMNLKIQQLEDFYEKAVKQIGKDQYTLNEYKDYLNCDMKCLNQSQKFNPKKKLFSIIEYLKYINTIVQNPIKQNLENTIRGSYEFLLKQNSLTKREIFLVNLSLTNQALACTIIDHKYLLVMIQKSRMLKLFDLLKKQLFKVITKQQKRKGIQNLLFSTSPSRGVGILKPNLSSQLWFS